MSDPKLDLLTPANCQLIFIDQQPQMGFGVHALRHMGQAVLEPFATLLFDFGVERVVG